MINAHISGNGLGSGGGFMGSVKRFIAVIAALGVGALMIVAAGVVAITTAIIGVIIAFVAMLFRFGAFRRNGKMDRSPNASRAQSADDPAILDARPTARGWTVDD